MDSITISLTNNLDKNDISIQDEKNNQDIELVLRQTNYTKEIAIQKLQIHNNNAIDVIKDYMGIKPAEKKAPIKSLNQEIYRQIRTKLDTSMSEYREKQPDGNINL
jgi:hypothetical protein